LPFAWNRIKRARICQFMRRFPLIAIGVAAVAGLAVLAQETTLKVQVDLVTLLCSVREKKGGRLVGNLNKEDFTVLEDGKEQTVKYFTRETDLPLTIGLLVDVSASQGNLIGVEQDAGGQFFKQVLRPKDLAFLIDFGPDAEVLQDFTNSYKLLRAGLDKLRVTSDPSGAGQLPGPVPTMSHPKGTILYDAVYLAASEQLKNQVGRKALVLITDGVDQGSHYKIEQAIEAAQRNDVIIYSVCYVDYAFYRGRFVSTSDSALKRMSDETGGHEFRVDRKQTLQQIFDELNQELRTQYSLAYTPTNPTANGGFRKIEIRTSNKDLKVQTRKGYYATSTGPQ